MGANERPSNPFSEEAALEELERTRQALEESRQRRKQASDAFDAFLRSFHQKPADVRAPDTPGRSVRSEPRPGPLPPPVPAAPAIEEPAENLDEWFAEFDAPAERTAPIATPVSDDFARDEPSSSQAQPFPSTDVDTAVPAAGDAPAHPAVPAALRSDRPRQPSPRRAARIAGTVILLGGAAFLAWRVRTPGLSTAPPSAGRPPVVEAPAPAAPPPAATVPAPPAAPPDLQAELTTLRPVWVRVLVDGEKTIERELPAGQKIPLSARQTIVVRAGDAGAVRMSVAGKDQGPFGPDGIPATRTFSMPGR